MATFSRPPEVVLPDRLASGSTLASSFDFRVAVFDGQADNTSAAAPATCGAAIDVPLR